MAKKSKSFAYETDLPKILKPMDLGGMYADKMVVNMDATDDRIMGLASGQHVVYPHRDYSFVSKFDEPYLRDKDERKKREQQEIQQRIEELHQKSLNGTDQDMPEDREPGQFDTYASIFAEYMNVYNFEQMDMVNPEDKCDYVAYLQNLEKTVSQYLGSEIDIYSRGPPANMRGIPKGNQNQKPAEPSGDKQFKKLRLIITSVNNQVLEMQQRILPQHQQRRPEWSRSFNPKSHHKEQDMNTTRYVGSGFGGDGMKKKQHRGDMLCITTTASQVPFGYEYGRAADDMIKQRELLQQWTVEQDLTPGSSMERPFGQQSHVESDYNIPGASIISGTSRPVVQQKHSPGPILKERQNIAHQTSASWRLTTDPNSTGGDKTVQDPKQGQSRIPRGVQMHFNEPSNQLGGIKFKNFSEQTGKTPQAQDYEPKQKQGIKHLDFKLKKQIQQRKAEMQKIVREQEYFNSITQDQIEKKLRFLEKAVGGPSRAQSDKSEESSRQSIGESAGVRESLGSRRLKGPMYGQNADEGSAQYLSDERSFHSDQVDGEYNEDNMKDHRQSPSPRYSNKNSNLKMNLSASECILRIKDLKDGYQNLTRKVIELREDGSQYFHQEFAANVQTYASNRKSKADLAQAIPQTLKPPSDAENSDPEEDGEEEQSQPILQTSQQAFDPVISKSPSAFSFKDQTKHTISKKLDLKPDEKLVEASPEAENDEEQVKDQKYKQHRNLESINKLASDSGSSQDARSQTSHGSKVRLAKNDGMGKLSQELLEEGDPIEIKRQEEAIEKVEPSIKGYQKGTQKSENIRLENDKKFKEFMKTMKGQDQTSQSLASIIQQQTQNRIILDQNSEQTEKEPNPQAIRNANDEYNDYSSLSQSQQKQIINLKQRNNMHIDSQKKSVTIGGNYNAIFVTGEKTLAPAPGGKSSQGIIINKDKLLVDAQNTESIQYQKDEIQQLSDPQIGGHLATQKNLDTSQHSKPAKQTEPQPRESNAVFRIIPNDPSIRHLPDVSSYEHFQDIQVPKKKRKKTSRPIYFQTTNQSPNNRSQAQYLVQSPQKMTSHVQYLPRESVPFLNKTTLLKGFNQRKGNLTKEERTNTLRKLAMARLQREETIGTGKQILGSGQYISVSKRISPDLNQTSVKFMHNQRIDSLDSANSKAQRRRNQSLLVQSEAEFAAKGSLNNFPIIIQHDSKANNKFNDHRLQLNSILRKTGQSILNQTTFPSAATDNRMNSIHRFPDDADTKNTNINLYNQQYQSKNKLRHQFDMVEIHGSKTDFSSIGYSLPHTDYHKMKDDTRTNKSKQKKKQLEDIYSSRGSQRNQQDASTMSKQKDFTGGDIHHPFQSSKMLNNRSNLSMNRTVYDSNKKMKSNQILEKMNIEQSAIVGMNDLFKPPIVGEYNLQTHKNKQQTIQPRNATETSSKEALISKDFGKSDERIRRHNVSQNIISHHKSPSDKQQNFNIMANHRMEEMMATQQKPLQRSQFQQAGLNALDYQAQLHHQSRQSMDGTLPPAVKPRPNILQAPFLDINRERSPPYAGVPRDQMQGEPQRFANHSQDPNDQYLIQQRVARLLSDSSKVFEQHLRQTELARRAHHLTNERAKKYIAYKQNEQMIQRALKRI